jgi:multidrug efflux pump
MLITDLAVRRPVSAMVLNALILVFGLIGYQLLSVREYPRADFAAISIDTSYPGAAPEVIDTVVTRVIEDQLAGLEGLDAISSTSRDGYSNVFLSFLPGRDMEAAANDVREGLARAARDLPATVDRPVMFKFDSSGTPIFIVTMTSSTMSPIELTDYARRNFIDQLSAVPGVARVAVWGERTQAMRIWLDRAAMTARRITAADVEDALTRENIDIVAGRIEANQRELTIRADTRLATPEAFRRLVVRQTDGATVRLGDIARVEIGPREPRGALRINGKAAVGLAILKQNSANTLDVAGAVRTRMLELAKSMPAGTEVQAGQDDSVPIRASIHEIFVALGVALALVGLIVLAFLRSMRAAAITLFAVPVSLAASFGVLALLGYSINVFTLLAMVLAIGLVVDDAIIVVENIVTRIQTGEPPLLAAYRGARQIGFAVVATTAVLMAVVLPLTLVDGSVGPMLREFAAALVSSLFFSAVAALTFGPVLGANLLRADSFKAHAHATFDRIRALYLALLDRALDRPVFVLGAAAAAYALLAILYLSLPQELAPLEDQRQFFVAVDGPEGASQDYMLNEMAQAEKLLLPYLEPGGEAKRVLMRLFGDGTNGGLGVNKGNLGMLLHDWGEGSGKTRPLEVVMDEVRAKLATVPGARFSVFAPQNLSGAPGNLVSFQLGGNTYDELTTWRDALFERLADSKILTNARSTYDETKPQLRVRIDRERAQDLGLDAGTISRTLEVMMAARRVGRFVDRGREYDVMLQAEPGTRAQATELQNFYIRPTNPPTPGTATASSDQLIPLAAVVQTNERAGPSALPRFDRQAAMRIDTNLLPGATTSEGIDEIRRAVAEVLPPEARIAFVGAAKQYEQTGRSTLLAFGLAVVIAFLVLAAQFESVRLPSLVMATVPLALLGGVASLALTSMTVNVYTQIGMVMLIGLIAKNAILIVEFSNQLREEGRSVAQAVREAAGARLRPILMTSIAAIGGAMPLAFASGAGAEARSAIGTVIIGGVLLGTCLSLVLTPVLYALLARGVRPVGAVARDLARLETGNAALAG